MTTITHDGCNPWPNVIERYAAAESFDLGSQLRPDELTERVRVELGNAFAAGALWQHARPRKDGNS